MADNELVSIIMPAYNAGRYLESAVQSVQEQTWPQWELLIVDDASKDNTSAIALDLQGNDPRIRFLKHQQNQGVAMARNFAMEQARGKYIAFLDSDDLWLPAKLETQLAFMNETGTAIAYSAYQRMDEQGRPLGTVVPPPEVSYAGLLRGNVIGNLTGIYDASRLGKQLFSPYRHEDYVAWLALVRKAGKARGVQEVLARYRVYSGSTSANKLRTLNWQWQIYRKVEKLSFVHACELMCFYGYNAISKRL